MAKTTPKTRNRKPQSYRFNATERERIKDDLRPALKSFITSMKATDFVHDRALPYLGGDWRLQDECDDLHNIPFPLWIDVDFREVKRAVDVLFPDEAADLKQNILDYIERRKREKRKRDRQRDRFFDMVNLLRSIWSRFKFGSLNSASHSRTLRTVHRRWCDGTEKPSSKQLPFKFSMQDVRHVSKAIEPYFHSLTIQYSWGPGAKSTFRRVELPFRPNVECPPD